MKRWIRWQGVLWFAVLVALIGVFWVLLIDILVEKGIETGGTKVVGARVELAEADVTFAPLGVTLHGLQVTNPDKPMSNAVEAGRIAFNVDFRPLLQRKFNVEEMAVQKLRFDTPRERSGAIEKKKRKEREEGKIAIAGFELPSAKEILAREELKSIEKITDLNERIGNLRSEWEGRTDQLPGPEEIQEYRDRIEKIKAGGKGVTGALSTASAVSELKKDISADRDRLKSTYADYRDQLEELRTEVDEARKAPAEEVRRLMDKYALSPSGGLNLTRLLFGDKIAGWVGSGLQWHSRLKPFYDRAVAKAKEPKKVKPLRAEGTDVLFKEHAPKPDFLIRHINLSAETKKGNFDGTIRNVTGQQHLIGAPLKISLDAEGLPELESARFKGSFDRTEPEAPRDTVSASVAGYRATNLQLSGRQGFPVLLESGRVNLDLNAELVSGRLKAEIDSRIRDATLQIEPEGKNDVAETIASALRGISTASLKANVSGTPEDYDIDLSSDLERVLQQAVGQVLQEKAQGLKATLREKVVERTQEPLEKLDTRFENYLDIKGVFDRRLDSFDELLSELVRSKSGVDLPF
ncbi:MAG TPA: TIGR03545 family protein [Desulfuromonadales bacterium]|nr:TIGR03545 family protein [Desulfuromonadales bacterium]